MTTSRNLRFATMPLLVLALSLLWCGYWFILSHVIRGLYASETARLADRGLSLSCDQENWGGFPFRIEFGCAGPVITFEHQGKSFRLASGNLSIIMQAYDYRHFIALVDGPTAVSGSSVEFTLSHHRASFSLVRSSGPTLRIAAEIPNLVIAGATEMRSLLANAVVEPQGVISATASARELKIEHTEPIELDLAGVEFSLPIAELGPLNSSRTVNLDIRNLLAENGDLTLSGSGSLAITSGQAPVIAVTMRVSDLDLLASRLKTAVPLTESEANAMRNILVLMSKRSKDAEVPLRSQDGILYWGPFRLFELPQFRF